MHRAWEQHLFWYPHRGSPELHTFLFAVFLLRSFRSCCRSGTNPTNCLVHSLLLGFSNRSFIQGYEGIKWSNYFIYRVLPLWLNFKMEAASVPVWRAAAPVARSWLWYRLCWTPAVPEPSLSPPAAGISAAPLDALRYVLGATWRTFRPNGVVFHEIYVLPAELAGERGCSGLKVGFSQCSRAKVVVRC